MRKLLWILILMPLISCGGSSSSDDEENDDDAADDATLSAIQDDIFTPTCAVSGCHSSVSAQEGLSLASGESFSSLVNVDSAQDSSLKLVEPGDPDNSYLIHKLEGTGSGSQMPRGGSALSDEDMDRIRDWITNGAENN
ncbi:MAG: c-type cytochrome domain-containing protein [Deltaproteobacteria bacterium]|nr:c-type cytochrome domain-containing protein [Deltaproteobacteria bacterium]